MRKISYLVVVILALGGVSLLSVGCAAPVCSPGAKQACSCGPLDGSRICKDDGSGFSICQCSGTLDEKKGEATDQEPIADGADASVDGPKDDGPKDDGPKDDGTKDDGTKDDGPKDDGPQDLGPSNCGSGEFSYNNNCYKISDFCTGQLQVSGLPQFPQGAEKSMKQPYELEYDPNTRKPLFCKTKEGHYYLGGSGYGQCDIDGDGWINIEAYRALTSTESVIKRNARCEVRKIRAVVYHAEGQKPQLQVLDSEVTLIETFRNDGGSKLTDLPVYTNNQATLPKTKGGACTASTDCATGEACYLGNCVAGRRFAPSEINTLTKGCIAGLDLNDNKLDDASETPSDTPDPANEFKPLLTVGYFVELHYGYFEKEYVDAGTKLSVYHIKERSRANATDKQGLALNCQEKADGFQPDYWKTCKLRDNQRCADPNDPTKTKPGLSQCWLKDVQRLVPSLFKCVVYDNTTDPNDISGHFHPSNYGFDNNYNRTVCSAKGGLNSADPTKNDVEFTCTKDDGTRAPDPAKKEVGWACVSFKSYDAKEKYIGSCIDESTEQVCGTSKDGKNVQYFNVEKSSYGLTRAGAQCGVSQGKGECDFAVRICTGGKWLACDKCDNCPQNTAGQKTICAGGVWPAGSCKLLKGPAPEACDGLDNDCDGSIDEDLPTVSYYKDNDGDTYGDATTKITACFGRQPTGHVRRAGDCNDNDKTIYPNNTDECNGKDDDCDGSIDEDAAVPITTMWYKDDDNDTKGDKNDTGFAGCKGGDATNGFIICPPGKACLPIGYSINGAARAYVTDNTDCCDKDDNVKPGQTQFFTSPSTACSTGSTNFWDYNCNGNNDTETGLRLCQCATKVDYREKRRVYCPFECKSTDDVWVEETKCNSTTDYPCQAASTNALNACILDKTHIFSAKNDYTGYCSRCCGGSCGAFGKGQITLTCSKSKFSGANASKWTPVASDGTSSLFAVAKNQFGRHGGTCYFLTSGKAPKCGDTVSSISSSAADADPPSFTPNDKELCSTSATFQCGANTWKAKCKSSHSIKYSDSYYYFKESSIGVGKQVGCN